MLILLPCLKMPEDEGKACDGVDSLREGSPPQQETQQEPDCLLLGESGVSCSYTVNVTCTKPFKENSVPSKGMVLKSPPVYSTVLGGLVAVCPRRATEGRFLLLGTCAISHLVISAEASRDCMQTLQQFL